MSTTPPRALSRHYIYAPHSYLRLSAFLDQEQTAALLARAKELLSLVAVGAAAALVLLVRVVQPERHPLVTVHQDQLPPVQMVPVHHLHPRLAKVGQHEQQLLLHRLEVTVADDVLTRHRVVLVHEQTVLPDEIVKEGTPDSFAARVIGREDRSFRKGAEGPGRSVTQRQVSMTGELQVTDPELLRAALVNGMGRGKAYGCGLMTLAREVQAS